MRTRTSYLAFDTLDCVDDAGEISIVVCYVRHQQAPLMDGSYKCPHCFDNINTFCA